jgi:hypothetical protein
VDIDQSHRQLFAHEYKKPRRSASRTPAASPPGIKAAANGVPLNHRVRYQCADAKKRNMSCFDLQNLPGYSSFSPM